MPKRPLTTCAQPGCPAPVERGRCAQHQRPETRPSYRQRGYTPAWDRIARAAIQAQPWCSRCGSGGSPDNPLQGDHILPISRGGANDEANCQVLCRRCNNQKGNRIGG